MGMTVQDDMWEAAQMLPEKQRAPFVYALVAYGMDGAEPKGSPAWLPVFHVIRDRLRMSAEASEKGRNMARARWERKREQDAAASGKHMQQHMHEHDAIGMHEQDAEYESEIEIGEPPYSPPMQDAPFWLRCLAAFNDAMGTAYTTMPEKCRDMLRRSEGAWSVEQIGAMVSFKRKEWTGTKYRKGLTPNTLFSPDHFEQYMHQAQGEGKEAERYAEYA